MNKKQLQTLATTLSVFKKTQKEMKFPSAENTAFSPYSSLFFSESPPIVKLFLLFLRKNLDFLNYNKKKLFVLLCIGISGVTLAAYYLLDLREKQEEVAQDLRHLQAKLAQKKEELDFLKENWPKLEAHQELRSARKLTRFEVGEKLKLLSQKAGFEDMAFSIMPEKKVFIQQGQIPAISTMISINYKAQSDTQLFAWIQSLSNHFPAFLVPRHLTIERVNTEPSLDGAAFKGVEGTYTFDWISVEK